MEDALTQKRDQVASLTTSFATFKESHTAAQQKLSSNEELLQTLITGLSNANAQNNNVGGGGGGYLGQIAAAKKRLQDASTEEESAKVRLGMVEKEFKEKDAKRKALEKEGGEGEKSLKKGKKDVEELRTQIEATGWSEEMEESEGRKAEEAREEVKRLEEVRSPLYPAVRW